MKKSLITDVEGMERAFTEIQVLRDLKHVNIIAIMDCVDHPDYLIFCMEYCGGGDLCEYIELHGSPGLLPDQAIFYFSQIVRGREQC